MTKRVVIISDTQLPYEDRRALRAVISFIGETQPDEVVHIGDIMDFPQPSSWSKATAAEFQGSVFQDAEYGVDKLIRPLREAYAGPIGMLEGNHDERPRIYLAKYAPALAECRALDIDQLLRFEEHDITKLPEFYEVAPGWVATHGHRGGIRINREAGKTALDATTKFGKSVVMGHTHRLGLVPKTIGYGAKGKTVLGFEVGNLMNMKFAGYLKGATANWQQGFGILTIDGNHVQATPVHIDNSRFSVDGKTYKL